MSTDDGQRRTYGFLLDHARSQELFTPGQLGDAVGWTGTTPNTYLGKQLKSVVEKVGAKYRVRRNFIYLKEDEFVKRTSQKESILPSYVRTSHDSVLTYEFLMPLTREDLLRQGLDRLFFKDTLEEQLNLLDLDAFEEVIPRIANEAPEGYARRIARKVSKYFGGYSITHVSGRFRVCDLISQAEAVGKRYIIDETTAMVRFIIPLDAASRIHDQVFCPTRTPVNAEGDVTEEVTLIRALFFTIFAEVVVHSVQGEDQIWLLETLHGHQRLYTWEVENPA